MLPHQQRVVDEKSDLDYKLSKLDEFIETPLFRGLHSDEQDRLRRQFSVMYEYSNILGERIRAFPSDDLQ